MTWEHAVSVIILLQLTIKDVIKKKTFLEENRPGRNSHGGLEQMAQRINSVRREQHVAAEL